MRWIERERGSGQTHPPSGLELEIPRLKKSSAPFGPDDTLVSPELPLEESPSAPAGVEGGLGEGEGSAGAAAVV